MQVYYVPEGLISGRNIYALSNDLQEAILGRGFKISELEHEYKLADEFIIAKEYGIKLSIPGSRQSSSVFNLQPSFGLKDLSNYYENLYDLALFDNFIAVYNDLILYTYKGYRHIIFRDKNINIKSFSNEHFPANFYYIAGEDKYQKFVNMLDNEDMLFKTDDAVIYRSSHPPILQDEFKPYAPEYVSISKIARLLSDKMLDRLGKLIFINDLASKVKDISDYIYVRGYISAKSLAYLLDFLAIISSYYKIPDDLHIDVSEYVYRRAIFAHAKFDKPLEKPEVIRKYEVNYDHVLYYITVKAKQPCDGTIIEQIRNKECLRSILTDLGILDQVLNVFNSFVNKLKEIYKNSKYLRKILLSIAIAHKASMYMSLLNYLEAIHALDGFYRPMQSYITVRVFDIEYKLDTYRLMYLPVFLIILGEHELAMQLYNEVTKILKKLSDISVLGYRVSEILEDSDIELILLTKTGVRKYPLLSKLVIKDRLTEVYSKVSQYVKDFKLEFGDDLVIRYASAFIEDLKQLNKQIDSRLEELEVDEEEEDEDEYEI